jgi:uncharacterized protein (DUF302 family)
VPCFLHFFRLGLLLLWMGNSHAADGVVSRVVEAGDFRSTHEALVEAVEAEGLVVGAVIPFGRMLDQTAGAREAAASPYVEAEIVQFCSAGIAWQMVTEDPAQIAFCPLSVAIYVTAAEPDRVTMVYRATGGATAARAKADALLFRLVERAAELARLRW